MRVKRPDLERDLAFYPDPPPLPQNDMVRVLAFFYRLDISLFEFRNHFSRSFSYIWGLTVGQPHGRVQAAVACLASDGRSVRTVSG